MRALILTLPSGCEAWHFDDFTRGRVRALPAEDVAPYSRLLTFSCFQRSIRTNDIHSRRAGACSRRVSLPCANGAISVADGLRPHERFFVCVRCGRMISSPTERRQRSAKIPEIGASRTSPPTDKNKMRALILTPLSGYEVWHIAVFTRDRARQLAAEDVAPYR